MSIQPIFPVFRLLFLCGVLLPVISCAKNDPLSRVPPNYRVQVGEVSLTFEQQMHYIAAALEIYRLHVGAYPSQEHNFEALIAKPDILEASGEWFGPYADSADFFNDPWGKRIDYGFDEGGVMDLRSFGPDGIRSDDDITAKEILPDWFREVEKLSKIGPIPIEARQPSSP